MTQQGLRGTAVRMLVGLAVVSFVGAGALLAIGPNRTADWKASDCGAPVRWLTSDHPYETVMVPLPAPATPDPLRRPYDAVTAQADCNTLVWRQIHWAAGLGATGLGLVVTSVVVAGTRRRRAAPVVLSAV